MKMPKHIRLSSRILSLSRALRISAIAALISLMSVACTGERGSQLATSGDFATQKAVDGTGAQAICHPDEYQNFERVGGYVVDLDRDQLPRGLFLASASELLIEKKGEPHTRVLIREAVGGKGAEIRCAENVDRLGPEFDLTMTGLVKFETAENPLGKGFTLRQFFFFQDRTGFGVVMSNPKLSSPVFDLRKLVRGGLAPGQLVRTGERSYLLRYSREREGGIRARLIVHLDLI